MSATEDHEESQAIKVWLECYQYLKIYSIWGNETLAELKNDPDTYEHIVGLWNQLGLNNRQKENEEVCGKNRLGLFVIALFDSYGHCDNK